MKIRKFSAVFFAATALTFPTGCTQSEKPRPDKRAIASNTFVQPAPILGEVWTPENDDEALGVLSENLKMIEQRDANDTLIHRDAHPKHHGCVKATLKMNASTLPADLRVGVFAAADGTSFDSWVRFSNGSPSALTSSDAKADVRGFAIKLMGVDGTPTGSQDFLMITARQFFSHNSADYIGLNKTLNEGTAGLALFGLTHPRDILLALKALVVIGNPLTATYYSAVPYSLGGEKSMRFEVHPCAGTEIDPAPGADASPGYLRERLIGTLAKSSACFDFFLQPNQDPDHNPVEDPRNLWDQNTSPLYKVAQITIPRQGEIDSEARLNFCENISYSPWHSLPATRPLGQINRTRAVVYDGISNYRHQVNGIPKLEPRNWDICTGDTAELCNTPHKKSR